MLGSQAAVAESDPFIVLTTIDDLERREDGVHFDHVDMLESGDVMPRRTLN